MLADTRRAPEAHWIVTLNAAKGPRLCLQLRSLRPLARPQGDSPFEPAVPVPSSLRTGHPGPPFPTGKGDRGLGHPERSEGTEASLQLRPLRPLARPQGDSPFAPPVPVPSSLRTGHPGPPFPTGKGDRGLGHPERSEGTEASLQLRPLRPLARPQGDSPFAPPVPVPSSLRTGHPGPPFPTGKGDRGLGHPERSEGTEASLQLRPLRPLARPQGDSPFAPPVPVPSSLRTGHPGPPFPTGKGDGG